MRKFIQTNRLAPNNTTLLKKFNAGELPSYEGAIDAAFPGEDGPCFFVFEEDGDEYLFFALLISEFADRGEGWRLNLRYFPEGFDYEPWVAYLEYASDHGEDYEGNSKDIDDLPESFLITLQSAVATIQDIVGNMKFTS